MGGKLSLRIYSDKRADGSGYTAIAQWCEKKARRSRCCYLKSDLVHDV